MSKSPAPFDQGLYLMHVHKGKEYFDQDKLQKAREELEAAYHLRPHDEKVLNMLGMTYYKMEMLPQAEEMYITLVNSNPDVYPLQSNLGLIQLKLNKLKEAADSLNRALELQPNNSKAHFYMGLLYEKQEMWGDAQNHFEMANADKMVAKMQGKLDEEREASGKNELLPFEVLEVLNDQTQQDAETELSSVVQQEMQTAGPEVAAESEITGRMKTRDLALAMEETADSPIEEEKPLENPRAGFHDTERMRLQDVFRAAQIVEVEELIEDHTHEPEPEPEQAAVSEPFGEVTTEPDETVVQEEQVEIPLWEKPNQSPIPEQVIQEATESEATIDIAPVIGDPFLLSDDIAADISTFLAQSRDGSPEEDVFYEEPSEGPFFDMKAEESLAGAQSEVLIPEGDPFGSRIPSPEEVENEMGSAIVESIESMEQAKALHEDVEELSDELPTAPFEQEDEVTGEPFEQEDEVEVNFAVVEDSDEGESPFREGFLQPSFLTPPIEEQNIERTQDMAFIVIAEQPFVAAESTELVPDETIPAEETPLEAEQVFEPAPDVEVTTEPVAEELRMFVGEENQAPVIDEPASEPGLEAVAVPLEVEASAMQTVEEPQTPAVDEPELVIPAHTPVMEPVATAEVELQAEEPAPAVEPAPLEPDQEAPAVAIEGTNTVEQYHPANLDQFSRDRFYIQPLIGSDRFLLIDPHLLEIIISEKLVCRIGTISSYTGNLHFTPWESEHTEKVPLVVVGGTGILFLADRRKEIFLLSLNNEVIHVESNHLLVTQSSLRVEPYLFQQKAGGSGISILKVSGRGTLALTCQTKPLTLNVHQGLPANIPAHAVIAWSGALTSDVMDDDDLHKMMSSDSESTLLRFRGSGDVVVEQGGLWGDRRAKKPH